MGSYFGRHCSHTPDLTLRYAALFHDVAKGLEGVRGTKDGRYTDYGHERVGADMAVPFYDGGSVMKSL